MMLVHIGQGDVASKVHNAWLKTIEDGMHTSDIYNEKTSKKSLSTKEFTEEVIARLGQKPSSFKEAIYSSSNKELAQKTTYNINTKEPKTLVGVDIIINWNNNSPALLAENVLKLIANSELGLQMISVKGLKTWPEAGNLLVSSDEWCLRFVPKNTEKTTSHKEIIKLLDILSDAGYDFVRSNNLYLFGDKLGFSLAQGE